MGGCKAFHYNGKYDERCGAQRFTDAVPHGLGSADQVIPANAPGDRASDAGGDTDRATAGAGAATRGGRPTDASQVEAWAEAHFTAQTVGGETVYNLTAPKSGS